MGSMNRGGLKGAVFELDDRFTGYDAETIEAMGLDGGKMLCRIAFDDPGSVATLESCGRAVTELARRRRIALIEPFVSAGERRPRHEPAHTRLHRHLGIGRLRTRGDERLYLAEASGCGRHGAGDGCHDVAGPPARRRPLRAT